MTWQAADARAKDVAKLKATTLQAGVAAVGAAPLADALRRHFSMLGLERVADNAARFDYVALRAGFERAYWQLAGTPYAHGRDWAEEEGGEEGAGGSVGAASPGGSPASGRKRARPAAAETAAEEEEAPAAKRGKAAGAAKKAAALPKKSVPQPVTGGRVTRARAAGAAAK